MVPPVFFYGGITYSMRNELAVANCEDVTVFVDFLA